MCNEENMIYIYRGYTIKATGERGYVITNKIYVIANKDLKGYKSEHLNELETVIDNHLKELDHQNKVLTNFNKKQRKKISKVFVRGGND